MFEYLWTIYITRLDINTETNYMSISISNSNWKDGSILVKKISETCI